MSDKTSTDEHASSVSTHGTQWSALAPVLTTVGTGIGLLGFVAFFGGAIIWVQSETAGLPANETVALVPKSVLLSTGAHFLTSALILALLGVGFLWVYNSALGDFLLKRAETDERKWEFDKAHLERELEDAKERLAVAERSASRAKQTQEAAQDAAASTDPENAVYLAAAQEATQTRVCADREVCEATDHLGETQAKLAREIPRLTKETDAAREDRKRRDMWTRLPLLGIPLVIAELALTTFSSLAWYDYLGLVALSAVTTSIILVVYAETERFTWFAVSAFLAIGLYIGVMTYVRTHDTPEAEPAAALIAGRLPLAGYFIAQTADRIYFGIPAQGTLPARMVALRRDDVLALAVGKSMPIRGNRAITAAKALAVGLCSDLVAGVGDASPGDTTSTSPRCRNSS